MESYDLDNICLKHQLNVKDIKKHHGTNDELYTALKKRLIQLRKNKKVLQVLRQMPIIEQKSPEWYRIRENLITASDFAQALGHGKFGNVSDIIRKKVQPQDESGASFSNPFFKWGNMFEPVACDIYSMLHHNIKVHEFGLIPHKNLKYFGASPDGITDIGIMLEIKCPYKRKIQMGGDVPKQYYYQIQGQLEVCGLEECDYFECQFCRYTTYNEFLAAFDNDDKIKGIVIECADGYKYSPIFCPRSGASKQAVLDWLETRLESDFNDITFWYLSHYNLKRVTFDKEWTQSNLESLSKVWDKILEYRKNPDKYALEVQKTITILDTQPLTTIINTTTSTSASATTSTRRQSTKMTGYCIIDDPEDHGA